MLTLNLQRLSKNIPTKGACRPINKSYIRHSTFDRTSGSMASAEVCSCQSKWQTKEEQIKALQEKAAEAQ